MTIKFHEKACDIYSVVDAVGTLTTSPSVAGTYSPASLSMAGALTAAPSLENCPMSDWEDANHVKATSCLNVDLMSQGVASSWNQLKLVAIWAHVLI